MRHGFWLMSVWLLWSACAGQSDPLNAAQARDKLRAALGREVHTRDERDDQSRLMIDAVEQADLERLTLSEVQAALGLGNSCQASDLCSTSSGRRQMTRSNRCRR
jgi:hypothetical protein